MGKPFFKRPPTENLNRSISNFELITTVLTSCYKPTFITLALRGFSAQYSEVAGFCLPVFFFSLLVTTLLRNAPVILTLHTSNDAVCDKEVPFGGLIDEKIFREISLFPNFSKGILHANRKSRITFERREIDENSKADSIPNRGQGIEW
jgi:hypothetical protein